MAISRADGFVYFINSPAVRLVKIGVANNVRERLKALQVGSADRLVVSAAIHCYKPYLLEGYLHDAARIGNAHAEWYRWRAIRTEVEIALIRCHHSMSLAVSADDRIGRAIARALSTKSSRPILAPIP